MRAEPESGPEAIGTGLPAAPGGLARAALLIAAVTVVARLAGFARTVVFARSIGPSCFGDAYVTSNTIPNILFDVVAGGALSSVVVPVLARPAASGERRVVDRTASALLSWCLLLLVPVALVGAALAHPLAALLIGHGHHGCSSRLEVDAAARMLIVFMPQVVLYGVGIVLTGVVQAHRRFLGPAVGPLVSSLVVIGVYLLFSAVAGSRETNLSTLSRGHELIVSVGTTLGVLALVLPLLVPTTRTAVRLRPSLRFPPGVAVTVRRMAVSGAVVLAGQDVATAVVLRLANDEGSRGSVVLYNLAWTVFLLPWAVLAVPLATSAFPTLTARWGAGDRAGYGAAVTRVLRVTAAVTAVAAAVMAAASGPVARLVVLGAPGHVAPTVLARGLATFAPGALAFGLTAALSRALYAQHDARTPAFAASGGWLAAIALDIVLVRALPATWTVAAVGAATTVGLTLTGGWLVVALRRTAGPAATAGLWRTIAASVAAAGVGGAVGVAIERLLAPTTLPQSLGTTVLVTAVVVALASLVLIASDRPTARLIAARLAGLVPGARRREVTDG